MPLISGKVVDERGQPAAWARVMVTRSPVPVPDIAMLTSDDGSFTLSVPVKGSYEIQVGRSIADRRVTATINV